MTGSLLWFDVALAGTLILLAVRVLTAPDLFQAIVLFIVFGLVMTIAWCRLGAIDVALAEAAIGAGLTGALFLNALAARGAREAGALPAGRGTSATRPVGAGRSHAAAVAIVAAGVAGVAVLAPILLRILQRNAVAGPVATTAQSPVLEALPQSGVTNPVTAVLLNFRAYDTLLEVAVLLLAVLAASSPRRPAARGREAPSGRVLGAFLRLVIPLIVVVAAYLLWAGAKAPGGAFQAAAMLCAAGVLLAVSRASVPRRLLRSWRSLLSLGLAVFLAVAFAGMLYGGRFLEIPAGRAGLLILLIEAALTLSIMAILVTLFAGGQPLETGRLPDRSGEHAGEQGEPATARAWEPRP